MSRFPSDITETVAALAARAPGNLQAWMARHEARVHTVVGLAVRKARVDYEWETRQERYKKWRREQEEREAAERAIREDTDGFADQFSALRRGKIIKSLLESFQWNRYGVLTRRDLVRQVVNAGGTIGTLDGQRWLTPDGVTGWLEKTLTKTAMDYAEWLIARRPGEATDDEDGDKADDDPDIRHLFGQD